MIVHQSYWTWCYNMSQDNNFVHQSYWTWCYNLPQDNNFVHQSYWTWCYNLPQDNNLERAVEWIFSHADELDTPMETEDQPGAAAGAGAQCRDGSGSMYNLTPYGHLLPIPHPLKTNKQPNKCHKKYVEGGFCSPINFIRPTFAFPQIVHSGHLLNVLFAQQLILNMPATVKLLIVWYNWQR